MKKRVLYFFIITTVFGVTLSSCISSSSVYEKYASVEKGAIPESFAKNDFTMLFITHGKKSYDKYLKRNVSEFYQGPYIFATREEMMNDYDDINQYPYYFDFRKRMGTYVRKTNSVKGPAGSTVTQIERIFGITDRASGKTFELSLSSGAWSKLQAIYLRNMEAERTKNESSAAK